MTLPSLRLGVKESLPHVSQELRRNNAPLSRRSVSGTMSHCLGIDIFTPMPIPLARNPHGESSPSRLEELLPAHPRPSPPSPGEGPGRTVPLRALLRPSRPRAGTLRDAAPPSGREALDPHRGQRLRGQPSYLLPRGGGLQDARTSRSCSPEAGPEGTPPMYSGNSRLRAGPSPEQSRSVMGRAAPGDCPEVWDHTSPENPGTGSRQGSKKRAPSSSSIEESPSPLTIEREYEALRKEALTASESSPSPPGMGVFLLRGWVGWAVSLPIFRPLPVPSPRAGVAPCLPQDSLRREAVRVFAGLVLSYLGGGS